MGRPSRVGGPHASSAWFGKSGAFVRLLEMPLFRNWRKVALPDPSRRGPRANTVFLFFGQFNGANRWRVRILSKIISFRRESARHARETRAKGRALRDLETPLRPGGYTVQQARVTAGWGPGFPPFHFLSFQIAAEAHPTTILALPYTAATAPEGCCPPATSWPILKSPCAVPSRDVDRLHMLHAIARIEMPPHPAPGVVNTSEKSSRGQPEENRRTGSPAPGSGGKTRHSPSQGRPYGPTAGDEFAAAAFMHDSFTRTECALAVAK